MNRILHQTTRGGIALLGLACLVGVSSAQAATVTTTFNTGASVPGPTPGTLGLLADGAFDNPMYTASSLGTVQTTPDTTVGPLGSTYVLSGTAYPAGTAYAHTGGAAFTNSKYISLAPSPANEPVGYYDFRTTFSLAGYQPSTASLSGQFIVDNLLFAVYLNGVQKSGPVVDAGFNVGFAPLPTLTSGFVGTTNTLDFIVYNSAANNGDTTPNPVAFRDELTLTATLIPTVNTPEPGNVAMLVGLGVSGSLFAFRRRKRA